MSHLISKTVSRLTGTLLLVVALSADAFATWSIILVDQVTKEIGIAGASCTPNVYGIGTIAPGKGAIIVQAMSNKEARSKGLKMILANASPQQILAELVNSRYDPDNQQYAVVCINDTDHPITYTGAAAAAAKGTRTAPGISVQGNTLVNEGVLTRIIDTIAHARKQSYSIHHALMLALEAGAKAGGDKRCGAQTATSAFITVARPDDNPGKPYLNLVVSRISRGGDNAVEVLREQYNRWSKDK
jgi:uncharacterized Ntn-hydrolase superfamily protein